MAKQLSPLRLPVRTRSGQGLGTVVNIDIDPDSQSVTAYHVKPNRLVPDVVWSPLIIRASQVISITEQGLVVDDANLRQTNRTASPQPTN
jgi:sporulation protein YlmC with PRC-barrel domain